MKLTWNACLKTAVTLFCLYLAITWWPTVSVFVGTAFSAALPLLIGAAIAYVQSIPMEWFERHFFPGSKKKWVSALRRPVCMVLSLLAVAAGIALIVVLVLPQLVDCIQLLLSQVPGVLDKAVALIGRLDILPEDIFAWLEGIDWQSSLMQIGKTLLTGVTDLMGTVMQTVSGVFSGIVTGFLSLIFAVYLLLGKEEIGRQSKKLLSRVLKEEKNRKAMYVLRVLDESFHKYIVGQCVEALILGVMCLIGMWILRLPYAAMISALIAFTALIPVAGAYIGAAVGAFMILTVSPVQALVFLIYIVVLQQVEGNLVYPRVVGTTIGLPAIWVLAAVTIGGGVMGIPGMLIGVPIAAAAYRILREKLGKEDAKDKTVKQTEVQK